MITEPKAVEVGRVGETGSLLTEEDEDISRQVLPPELFFVTTVETKQVSQVENIRNCIEEEETIIPLSS